MQNSVQKYKNGHAWFFQQYYSSLGCGLEVNMAKQAFVSLHWKGLVPVPSLLCSVNPWHWVPSTYQCATSARERSGEGQIGSLQRTAVCSQTGLETETETESESDREREHCGHAGTGEGRDRGMWDREKTRRRRRKNGRERKEKRRVSHAGQ